MNEQMFLPIGRLPGRHALLAVLLAMSAGVAQARAEEEVTPEAAAQAQPAGQQPSNPAERGFLFTVDPSLPAPGHVAATAGMGNVTRSSEERPVGAGQLVPTLGAELALLPRLSVYAEGGAAFVQAGNPGQIHSPFLFEAGAHILLTNPTSQTWQLSLRPSYGYDFTGTSFFTLVATGGFSAGGFRVVASLQGSHTFESEADPLDVQATAGATYALPYGLRAGIEGVVADLEEIADRGAEGGVSAFAGPTLGWELGRFQVVAGPAFGVTPGALHDAFLFRAAACLRL
jgi:hypothetical protein